MGEVSATHAGQALEYGLAGHSDPSAPTVDLDWMPTSITEWPQVLKQRKLEQEATDSINMAISFLLSEIQQLGISLAKQEEIREYLVRFPDLIDVMLQVARTAHSYLPEAHLSLEIYHDPEVEDEHLVIYARQEQYDKTTMMRIRDVRSKYRPLLLGRKGWLILTTDFRPVEG
jgi:hypothetical protein